MGIYGSYLAKRSKLVSCAMWNFSGHWYTCAAYAMCPQIMDLGALSNDTVAAYIPVTSCSYRDNSVLQSTDWMANK